MASTTIVTPVKNLYDIKGPWNLVSARIESGTRLTLWIVSYTLEVFYCPFFANATLFEIKVNSVEFPTFFLDNCLYFPPMSDFAVTELDFAGIYLRVQPQLGIYNIYM